MNIINIHQAKTRLSEIIAQVEAGEEVVIARANKPVARLVPISAPAPKRRLGEAAGLVEIMPDFDALPEEFLDSFD